MDEKSSSRVKEEGSDVDDDGSWVEAGSDYDSDVLNEPEDYHVQKQEKVNKVVEHNEDDDDEVEEEEEHFFPVDLYNALKKEVQALSKENIRLSKELEDAELKLLNPKRYAGFLDKSSRVSANKIFELSKKVRELNAELLSAKLRASKAEDKLAKYEKGELKKAPSATKVVEPPKKSEESVEEVKDLSEKLNSANIKLCESRNQISQLKHDIKILQKTLASELGDNASLQSALAPGWRGRAQQIITLQLKVNELNEKLSLTNISSLDRANLTAQIAHRQAEKERQAEQVKELDSLKGEVDDLKMKLDASKARNRVLTSEISSLKSKVSSMQEKSNHDDQLISVLTGQLSNANEKQKDKEACISVKVEEELRSMRTELSQERARSFQFQNIIKDRDEKILHLEEKLNLLPQLDCVERPYSRGQSSEYQDAVSVASETERMKLMELLTVTNKRLEEEREAFDKAQEQLRQERHKCSRLETKLARLELDRVGCSRGSGYKLKSKSTTPSQAEWESLKDKAQLLEEKCLALETRLCVLRQEKEEDNKIYRNLIEETRHSFMDQLKKSTSA